MQKILKNDNLNNFTETSKIGKIESTLSQLPANDSLNY